MPLFSLQRFLLYCAIGVGQLSCTSLSAEESVSLEPQRNSTKSVGDALLGALLPALEQSVSAPRGEQEDRQSNTAAEKKAYIADYLACQLSRVYLDDMPREDLFVLDGSVCVPGNAINGLAFSDPQCKNALTVRRQDMDEYCSISMDELRLGDGSPAGDRVNEWLLTPGTRLEVTLPWFEDTTRQPYQGSVNFQQTYHPDRGSCALEMRIYTPKPGATNLRPVLAFHGGSWSQRGAGFLGLESLISHFTSRGMVVFAPFYRLAGDQDGPTACRGFVAEDILGDASAALDWVKAHGTEYGARAGKVGVFGQSAGGFLAAWLAMNQVEDVDAALLMYAPTDVGDFVDDLETGVYTSDRGEGIIERFLGVDRANWYDNPVRIAALSLAQQVRDGAKAPAIRMIHGLADDLVLPNQSIRLCDALNGGRAETVTRGNLQQRACGPKGQLDLIKEAEHALEVCIVGADCKAGDVEAAQDSLFQAYDWLATYKDEEVVDEGNDAGDGDDEPAEAGKSGGAAVLGLWLPVLMGLFGRRFFSVSARRIA